ncbi:MAG: M48 family metalloprotease [Deltaproteobacteria bacterium]|nr:M48 family metalloprotease [Deltaproteobacteria bacterium]
MKKSIPLRRISLLVLVLIFIITPGRYKSFALSINEEKELGQKFLDQIRNTFELEYDDFVNEYINELGEYLTSFLDTIHFPFHFYVIKDNNLNAFAAPGGHIFLFSGMIESLDEIDELAAIICHELAHISERHLSNRIEQSKKIGFATLAGVLAGSLIGGKAAEAIITGTIAAGVQKQLSFSREDERQADQLGFRYMADAGFNPGKMATVLKKIQEGNYIGSKSITPYLLTHPGGSERMSNIDSMMTDFLPNPANKPPEKYQNRFPVFKTILKGKKEDHQDSINFFNRQLDKNPDDALANLGLGIVYMEKADYEASIDHFERALAADGDRLIIYRYLGQSYQLMGKDLRAIEIFDRALGIERNDKSSLYMQALSFQNIGEYPKSIQILERLSFLKPVKNDVFYNLGISYGRYGQLDLAHYNFGIFFQRESEKEKAKFHFDKAVELSKGNPSLLKRIEDARESQR